MLSLHASCWWVLFDCPTDRQGCRSLSLKGALKDHLRQQGSSYFSKGASEVDTVREVVGSLVPALVALLGPSWKLVFAHAVPGVQKLSSPPWNSPCLLISWF